jgi:hypothetical protein
MRPDCTADFGTYLERFKQDRDRLRWTSTSLSSIRPQAGFPRWEHIDYWRLEDYEHKRQSVSVTRTSRYVPVRDARSPGRCGLESWYFTHIDAMHHSPILSVLSLQGQDCRKARGSSKALCRDVWRSWDSRFRMRESSCR